MITEHINQSREMPLDIKHCLNVFSVKLTIYAASDSIIVLYTARAFILLNYCDSMYVCMYDCMVPNGIV
jgi:hypothetical protein